MAARETKRIVFFTLPPVREIDLVGAVDVFTSANRAVGSKPLYDIKIVNAEKARADRKIAGMCGLSLYLSLALLEEDHGAALALEVARVLVVFLRRPGNQSQFSVSLRRQSLERNPLRELRVWMAEHLTADLSVPALAQRVAMSPRNFQRVFTSGAGKSPARYVEELRIETARRLLERTTQTLDEIADSCGFGSADVMARAFTRVLQLTPGEYRSRFRSSGIGK
jgi:transcriptional regulator GlxA family with amidase domain